MFVKDFFQQFLNSSELSQSPNDILLSLSKFRVSVTPEVCKRLSTKQLIDDFEKVFFRFFNCSESDSASVRVSTFPALISFLSKMIRYYPVEIQTAFIHFATKQAVPSKGSIIIASIFAYICNFVAKPFLEKFVNSVPVFHHFTMSPSNSDHLFHVISWLPVFDFNSLIAMLMSFLNQYKATHNLQLLNPIKTIVEMNPDQTMPEILKNGDMTLIAYLFTSLKIDGNKYDLNSIAHQSLEKLKTAEFSEIEDCFQILSIKSSSFQTNIKILSENEMEISLNDNEKKDSIVLQVSNYINTHPYFYALRLPNSLLFPKDGDSSSIISIKFQTISKILSNKNEIMDVEEYIDIYDKFCCHSNLNDSVKSEKFSYHYNEIVSSALKSFASSLPCLIANSTDFKLIRIIKFVINAKIKSWVHGIDVLRVIEALDNELMDYIPLKNRILLLLSFSMNKNEVLSEKAIEIISKLTNSTNFVYITDLITKDIDFFSHFSIQKHLRSLSRLIQNPNLANQNRKHLKWIYLILLSVENDYLTDLYTLSEVFNFMQFVSKSPMKRLVDISYTILIYAILYLKGKDFTNTISTEFTFYGEKVENYLNKKLIDITNQHPFDFIENFPLIRNAFTFYMRQQKERKSVLFMIEHFFVYFPHDATMKLYKHEDKILINKLYKKLIIVTDSRTISLWCKMMPKNDFLVDFAKYYLESSNSHSLRPIDFYNFITFLDTYEHKYEAMIIVSLLDMDQKIASEVVLQCLQNHSFASKFSKQLSTFTSSFYKTEFSSKSDEEKLKIVRSIIDENKNHRNQQPSMNETELNNNNNSNENLLEKEEQYKLIHDKNYLKERKDVIDFALNHLEGWEKIIFEDIVSNINQKIKPRAFFSSLKLKTRVLDDTNSQFLYYMNIFQVDKMKQILRLSIIRNEIINIDELKKNGHYIPENVQQMIIKFYKKRHIKINDNEFDINNQIQSYLTKENENDYFHLSKNQIKNLYSNRKIIENTENLFKLLKLLIQNYKNNNFHVILLIFCSFIKDKNGKSIPKDFIDFYFDFLKTLKVENNEELQFHLKEISYSLFLLSRKVKFSYEQNQIIRALFGICPLNSVEVSYLLSTMIFIENSNNESIQIDSSSSSSSIQNKFVFGNLNEIIKRLTENEIPSLFVSGVRILRQIHSLPNIYQIGEIIEPFIYYLFLRIRECQYNFPIIFFFKHFLINLFSLSSVNNENPSNESKKKIFLVQFFALNNVLSLIQENDEFNVLIGPSINCCLANMKNYSSFNNESFNALVNNNDKNNKNLSNSVETFSIKTTQQILYDLTSFSDNLIFFKQSGKNSKSIQIPPINIQKLVFYIKSLHFRTKGIDIKSTKEVELMSFVMKYVQSLRNFDSYKIRDVYNEWLSLLMKDLSYEFAIKVLLHKFMTNSMRFFPVFVIIAKEVKKIDASDNVDNKKFIDSELMNVVKVIHDEMHIMALQGLIDRKPFQEILDIALIENYA